MIDPISLAAKISGTTEPTQGAVRSARLALAACWDDCRDSHDQGVGFPPNPYRRDNDDVAQPADRYETWRDVDVTTPADDGDDVVNGPQPPDGVWIVWRSHGDPSNGFNAIYPADDEIGALRQVNGDGFGSAQFIEYGPYQG